MSSVNKVIITNRGDCCEEKIVGAQICTGCLETCDFDDVPNAAGGQEDKRQEGISSRNSRCLCFALFMDAQIGQTEKTQRAFIMYENVFFRRG